MDSAVPAQQQLEEFANQILTEKNLPGLSDDVRPGVIAEMVQVLHELINRAILDALPENKLQELDKLTDDPEANLEQIQQLVESGGVDTQQIVTDTLTKFRELYLTGPEGAAQ